MINNQFIWLTRSDPAYKGYEASGWHNILTIKNDKQDVYHCFSQEHIGFSLEQKNTLIAPLCIREVHQSDFLVIFKENKYFGFLWQNDRCFSLDYKTLNALKDAKLNIFRTEDIYLVDSIEQLVSISKINKETAIDFHPLLLIFISIMMLVLSLLGIFVWLL